MPEFDDCDVRLGTEDFVEAPVYSEGKFNQGALSVRHSIGCFLRLRLMRSMSRGEVGKIVGTGCRFKMMEDLVSDARRRDAGPATRTHIGEPEKPKAR